VRIEIQNYCIEGQWMIQYNENINTRWTLFRAYLTTNQLIGLIFDLKLEKWNETYLPKMSY